MIVNEQFYEDTLNELFAYAINPKDLGDKYIQAYTNKFDEYKANVQERYSKFLAGENNYEPIVTLGDQPKHWFKSKKTQDERNNWTEFYTNQGKQQIGKIVCQHVTELLNTTCEAEKIVKTENQYHKGYQRLLEEATKSLDTYITFMLLKDQPFFLQDFVKWYNLNPEKRDNQFVVDKPRDFDLTQTPSAHWSKEMISDQTNFEN